MEREAFTLAHGDTGIADVVGHPVGEAADAVHLVLGAPQELIDFFLYSRCGLETAVVLVDAVEPAALGLPVWAGGEQQLALHIVAGESTRLALQGCDVVALEGVERAAILIGGDSCYFQFAVIYLVLQLLAIKDVYLIHLLFDGFAAPEWYDVVEVALHGWHIALIAFWQRCKSAVEARHIVLQQGVGVAFLVCPYLEFVTRLQMAYLDHLLAGAPVDEACGCYVVVYGDVALALGPHQRVGATVEAMHHHSCDIAPCRQRVVIHLHSAPLCASSIGTHLYQSVGLHMAEPRFFHVHSCRVVQRHRVRCWIFVR